MRRPSAKHTHHPCDTPAPCLQSARSTPRATYVIPPKGFALQPTLIGDQHGAFPSPLALTDEEDMLSQRKGAYTLPARTPRSGIPALSPRALLALTAGTMRPTHQPLPSQHLCALSSQPPNHSMPASSPHALTSAGRLRPLSPCCWAWGPCALPPMRSQLQGVWDLPSRTSNCRASAPSPHARPSATKRPLHHGALPSPHTRPRGYHGYLICDIRDIRRYP
jgi:hypothetical protein